MSGITDPSRAERYIRRRWGRLLKDVIYFDVPNPHGWNRYWFALVTFDDDQFQTIPVLSQSYLTSPTGSLQTTNGGVDSTWNSTNNTVDCVGPGGSGGAANQSTIVVASGGGGGAFSRIANFTITNPGTTTFQWQIGTGGAAASGTVGTSYGVSGNPGASATWWNAASDPVGSGTAQQCSAAAGGGGTTTVSTSGAGGATANSSGTTKNAGGSGGQMSTSGAAGGGGAAGPNGAGNNGVNGTTGATAGGQGDSTSGGTGGAGVNANNAASNPGTAGTEFGDSVHGSGGGGGGLNGSNNNATFHGGNAGLYGAGGGGYHDSNVGASGQAISGTGAQGIIVLTWTPSLGKMEWYNLTIFRVLTSGWRW